MEKNTVTLDLIKYHEFQKLEKAFNENKVVVKNCSYGYEIHNFYYEFLNIDESIDRLSKIIESKNLDIERLTINIQELKEKNRKEHNDNIDNKLKLEKLKQMSIWEFLKWRKNNS